MCVQLQALNGQQASEALCRLAAISEMLPLHGNIYHAPDPEPPLYGSQLPAPSLLVRGALPASLGQLPASSGQLPASSGQLPVSSAPFRLSDVASGGYYYPGLPGCYAPLAYPPQF